MSTRPIPCSQLALMPGIRHEDRHDGRRHAVMTPGDDLAVLVEAGLEALDRDRVVEAVADVVLAGPDHLDRSAADPPSKHRAASTAKSGFDLRPNPPPRSVTLTVTFSGASAEDTWRPDHAPPEGFARSSRFPPCRRQSGSRRRAAPWSHAHGEECSSRPRLSCPRSQGRAPSCPRCARPAGLTRGRLHRGAVGLRIIGCRGGRRPTRFSARCGPGSRPRCCRR